LRETGAESLLVTQKDFVKIAAFNLPISLLALDLKLNRELIETVREYVDAKED
jgi:tetraacyldisaccharide-1-P 4'-kinase